MQGINAKDHKMMLATFSKYEQMTIVARDMITDEEHHNARDGISELNAMYGNFKRLMHDLQDCVKQYEGRRRSVQSIMNRNIRKMHPKVQQRNRYLK